MVRSDSKIDEDWERKLRERERREYGERERERNGDKEEKKCVQGEGSVFFLKTMLLQRKWSLAVRI